MSQLIVPYFAVGSGDEITIDGVTYKVPRIDSAGRVYVNPYVVGASEVKAARGEMLSTTTRATLATPASGKKIRVISVQTVFYGATAQAAEVYFGTGANITTNAGKEIVETHNGALSGSRNSMVWPDGGGPVGAANDVLSMRTSVNVAEAVIFYAHYREE